jgi:exoribonuclease-2
MLPETAIDAFTLAAGGDRCALSLYAEVGVDGTVVNTRSRCERVPIAANLRIGALEAVFNQAALAAGPIEHEFGAELEFLWRFAQHLQVTRGKPDIEGEIQRVEYNFHVIDGRVAITERKRGSPIDKVVSELMIYANAEWGGQLARAGYAGIYRAQSGGVARMTTVASRHDGLGVAQYAWSSSPLRRYVDLINQRQLLALFAGQPALYQAGDEALLAALREFELAYDAYAEFQRSMERYWCLRWIEQEGVTRLEATVLRESLVRCDRLPLVLRVPSLREAGTGDKVTLTGLRPDPWELNLHAEHEGIVSARKLKKVVWNQAINDVK